MTLTRKDLRADENELYGWRKSDPLALEDLPPASDSDAGQFDWGNSGRGSQTGLKKLWRKIRRLPWFSWFGDCRILFTWTWLFISSLFDIPVMHSAWASPFVFFSSSLTHWLGTWSLSSVGKLFFPFITHFISLEQGGGGDGGGARFLGFQYFV